MAGDFRLGLGVSLLDEAMMALVGRYVGRYLLVNNYAAGGVCWIPFQGGSGAFRADGFVE